MTEYVCGFMFDVANGRVVLIRKARPDWQAGRLNGVGGHVEAGETPRQAMRREYEEESGQDTFESDWVEFVTLTGKGWRVHFFRGTAGRIEKFREDTDEPCGLYWTYNLPSNVLPNLRWLVPLARDTDLDVPIEIADHSQPAVDGMTSKEPLSHA